jgi:serine phosphatase RsbU (regulator of sigma subunit)
LRISIGDIGKQQGDAILMLSDGFAKQKNDRGELFNYDRIQNIFQEPAQSVPDDTIKKLVNTGKEWMNGQEQENDISLIVLKFR